MAQLNAPKAFDTQTIDPKVLKTIQTLVEFINQNFDQLIRAFSNQLTFADNFKATIITVSAKHNTATVIEKPKDGISSIIPLKVADDGLRAFKYSADSAGRISATFQFMNPIPIKARSVTSADFFSTYEVQSSLAVSVGDTIVTTSYSNKNNNGTFLVIGKSANTVVVYNREGAAETKTDFTGTGETARDVTLLLLS